MFSKVVSKEQQLNNGINFLKTNLFLNYYYLAKKTLKFFLKIKINFISNYAQCENFLNKKKKYIYFKPYV